MELNLNKENATEEEILIAEIYNMLGKLCPNDFRTETKFLSIEKLYNNVEKYIINHKWNINN